MVVNGNKVNEQEIVLCAGHREEDRAATGRVMIEMTSGSKQLPSMSLSQPLCDDCQVVRCVDIRTRQLPGVSVCAVPLHFEQILSDARRARRAMGQ